MSQFLIYKSSAGSGKTTALIGIFLKLALSSTKPGAFKRILAITFTNKAANEMKERLISELEKFSKLPDNYSGGDFMADQIMEAANISASELRDRAWRSFQLLLHDYGDLGISTIDTFNQRLIRAFSRELNLKADYEVELEQKALFHDAVIRLVEGIGKDDHLTRHLVGYVSKLVDEDQKVNIIKNLEDLEHLVLKDESIEAVQSLEGIPKETFEELAAQLKAETAPYPKKVRKHGEESLAWMEGAGIGGHNLAGKSNSWPTYFKKMVDFDGKTPVSLTATQEKLLEKDWIHSSVKSAERTAMEALMPELERRVNEAIAINTEEFKEYIFAKTIYDQLNLVAIIGDLFSTIETIREERNILPISYFNRIVSEALREEPVAFLYENFGNRYDHILIDEFQDTSTLQWHNLLPLVDETLARGKQSLVVGDAKQSIYRWRGGKAEQLIALPEIAVSNPELKASIRRNAQIERLNTNYRSLPQVVAFNNALTSSLGTILTDKESIFGLEYDAESVSQTVPKSKTGGYAEVQYLGKSAKKEAHWDCLLKQIARARDSGVPYGDMAVLVRKSSDGREVATFLQEQGIAVVTSDSYEIDRHPEVKFVISMLRLGVDPNLVPPKLSAMRSLCTIYGWEYAPHRYASAKNIDLNAFLKDRGLAQLKETQRNTGAYQECENIASSYIPSLRNRNSISTLLNSILKFGGVGATTSDFLTWWDGIKDKPSAAQNASGDAIQLLTIHKSKGLQFKVCFLPFINWQMDHPKEVIWAPLKERSMGPLRYAPFKLSDLEKCGFDDLKKAEDEANKFDNLNIIYVALTRAEEQLYICFTQTKSNFVGSNFFDACKAAAGRLSDQKEFIYQATDDKGNPSGEEISAENPFILSLGQISQTTARAEVETALHNVIQSDSPIKMWYERFQMAYDLKELNSDLSRKTGILFHNLAAEVYTQENSEKRLNQWLAEGHINEVEKSQLNAMISDLLQSAAYKDALTGAKIYAERELVHRGKVLRPDLVAEHPKRAVVIDFKTGEESEDQHILQVAGYMEAVSQAFGKPTEGYVVYTAPMRWVKVESRPSATVQATLFD